MMCNCASFKQPPPYQIKHQQPDPKPWQLIRAAFGALLLWAGPGIPHAFADEVPFLLPPTVDEILGPDSVDTGDIDGDAVPDVVVAARDRGNGIDGINNHLVGWYKYNKATGAWSQTINIIDQGQTAYRPVGLAIGNIDDVNGLDVVVGLTGDEGDATDHNIVWYANPGNGAGTWTRTVIDPATDNLTKTPDGLTLADVDADGDQDVIAAFRNTGNVYWYANPRNGGGGIDQPWTKNVIAPSGLLPGPRWIAVLNIDNDGLFDILVASSQENDNNGTGGNISWFENTGAGWAQQFIDANDPAVHLVLADIDKNGTMDVAAALRAKDQIVWYSNPGNGSVPWNTQVTIANDPVLLDSVRKLAAADVDGDGDTDFYSVSVEGDTVLWHDNPQTGANTQWVTRILASGGVDANGAASIASADFDTDGDPDAFAALFFGDALKWFRNGRLHGVNATPSTGLTVTEAIGAGRTATFQVSLTSAPTTSLSIPVSSSDITEGTVSPATLTFTTANFATPQTVTVTGVDDLIGDGNTPFLIRLGVITSTDPDYNGIDPADVSITNIDNDAAGVTVNPVSLQTMEGGPPKTFTVVLNTQPTANVTVAVSSLDATEGTVSPAPLVFTPAAGNWNTPKTVTVTGVNDNIDDGDVPYVVQVGPVTSTDSVYAAINPADVNVVNQDDADTAGFTVVPTSGLSTSEAGFKTTFTIRLNSQPTANVSIGLNSSNGNEGIATPTSLTFTTVNWNTPQTVTVTGINDAVADGPVPYNVVFTAATSTDLKYAGLTPPNVSLTNFDDEGGSSANVLVSPISGPTTESGGKATFTVGLSTNPQGSATMTVTSSKPGEGTVSPSSLTFDTGNWTLPQTVTVTGVDDNVTDGNVAYSIILGTITGTSAGYIGINPPAVAVTNQDNEAGDGNAIFSNGFEGN